MSTPSMGRRYAARQLIDNANGQAIPQYGSETWLALPFDDPRRIGAYVIAAECWASAGDTLEDDLRREVEWSRAQFKADEDEAYQANAQAHRERYEAPAVALSFTARRAAQLAASRPRAGDYMGRSTSRSGGEVS